MLGETEKSSDVCRTASLSEMGREQRAATSSTVTDCCVLEKDVTLQCFSYFAISITVGLQLAEASLMPLMPHHLAQERHLAPSGGTRVAHFTVSFFDCIIRKT